MKQLWLCIIGGLLIMGGSGITLLTSVRPTIAYTSSAPSTPEISAATPKPVERISGEPVKLDVPSVDISLDVIPGRYNTQTRQWTLTLDKAQFATLTPFPNNQEGNTLIYGHYRKGVFLNLPKVRPGDIAMVTTENGHRFYYRLTAMKIVKPDESDDIFKYRGGPILTLQTCTGLFYQNRELFIFTFVKEI